MRPALLTALLIVLAGVLPMPTRAQSPLDQQAELLGALRDAEQGRLQKSQLLALQAHPLRPWLEAMQQRAHLAAANRANVEALLQGLGDQPAATWLREAWLAELARRQDWPGLLASYPGNGSAELRCAALTARLRLGRTDADWDREARELWRQGRSLPGACDPVFAALEARGQLDAALRWERIELAAREGQSGLMRFLAGKLPAPQAALARDYADFIDAPHARTAGWPRDPRSRLIATEGLLRLARRSPDAAEAQLRALAGPLGLDTGERGRVLYEIALWTVASYLPQAAERLAAVPAEAYDERLHEWRVREALNRRAPADALRALQALPAAMQMDARWQYFQARMHEQLGAPEAATPLLAAAARQPSFHGFLAADRLQQPYVLCPLEPPADPALRARVAALPGLRRALALFAAHRRGLALREWNALLPTLSDAERYLAIELAQQAHWYDRAVFSIGNRPEDLRQYRLRFPLHHADTLKREAQRHDLDPAWVAALTRAESAFMPEARSPADARGLMQLLPSTAQMTARRLRQPWEGAGSLYRPNVNLALGTAHLRFELDKHDGLPWLAMAAYNAGPAPVARWRQARADLDPDLFIETINYRETRDYVARVSAFSVIYDWRLHGQAMPLTERLAGADPRRAQRRPFHCPSPAPLALHSP